MKLTMGSAIKSEEKPGTIENHFGMKFEVQEDGTLVTGEIPKDLLKVAEIEIASGRLLEHKSAQQEAEDAAKAAKAAAAKAAKASRQAKKDAAEAGKASTEK